MVGGQHLQKSVRRDTGPVAKYFLKSVDAKPGVAGDFSHVRSAGGVLPVVGDGFFNGFVVHSEFVYIVFP